MHQDYQPFACDLYHLTQCQTWWQMGMHNTPATYEMYIRSNPFNSGYTVSAGLGPVLEWLKDWNFDDAKTTWLAQQGFKPAFIDFLRTSKLQVSIDAIPEGELMFPNEPILRVTGPLWQVNYIETAQLNKINPQSLFATKASRVLRAAQGRSVMEFGLRRAQSDLGLVSSRGAAVGGILTTSNCDAAFQYGLQASGTMAHAFIMSFESELDAFKAWLAANPDNGVLLIDTFDTIGGAKNAVRASIETGVPLKGVRIDSGDLAYLSKEVRKILRTAGMDKTQICLSNDLDEYAIESLIAQGAEVNSFGVGTKLATAYDQAALGGVYKLKSIYGTPKIKLSNDPFKTTIPGDTSVLRMLDSNGMFAGDVIIPADFNWRDVMKSGIQSVDMKTGRVKTFGNEYTCYQTTKSVVTNGRVDGRYIQDLKSIARQTNQNLDRLDVSHKRFMNPHTYVAGLEMSLWTQRQAIMQR